MAAVPEHIAKAALRRERTQNRIDRAREKEIFPEGSLALTDPVELAGMRISRPSMTIGESVARRESLGNGGYKIRTLKGQK